jgi:hypothetical protein
MNSSTQSETFFGDQVVTYFTSSYVLLNETNPMLLHEGNVSGILWICKMNLVYDLCCYGQDYFCGVVDRVSGCRPRGPGVDSWRYQIF